VRRGAAKANPFLYFLIREELIPLFSANIETLNTGYALKKPEKP
jgi:hypothetical protein